MYIENSSSFLGFFLVFFLSFFVLALFSPVYVAMVSISIVYVSSIIYNPSSSLSVHDLLSIFQELAVEGYASAVGFKNASSRAPRLRTDMRDDVGLQLCHGARISIQEVWLDCSPTVQHCY